MFEWCSMSVSSTSSPSCKKARPQACATMLSDSVVPRVLTIEAASGRAEE